MANPLDEQKRRARQAIAIFKSIDRVWDALPKVPSYSGKARFMDSVLKVRTRAFNLAFNLATEADLPEKELQFESQPRSAEKP